MWDANGLCQDMLFLHFCAVLSYLKCCFNSSLHLYMLSDRVKRARVVSTFKPFLLVFW